MKLLIVTKLADRTLESFILSIVNLNFVEKIYVLRDKPFISKSDKIESVIPSNYVQGSLLRHLEKLLKGMVIGKKQRVDLVVSTLLYPHGYIGTLIGKVLNIPHLHIIIAGHREIWLFGSFMKKLNIWLLKHITSCTVTGTNTEDYLLSNGIPKEKIFLLPNVIEMNMFYKVDIDKKYDIISLGRLWPVKNVSTVIKSLAILINKHLDIKLCIIGDGPEKENLIYLAKSLQVYDNIEFRGRVPDDEINKAYNEGKIIVITSKGEGFPLTLLEAMACGVVPVASDVGDISYVIKDNENGLILKNPDDEVELAGILQKVLFDNDLRKRLSNNALNVRNKFSYEASSQRWKHILTELKNW